LGPSFQFSRFPTIPYICSPSIKPGGRPDWFPGELSTKSVASAPGCQHVSQGISKYVTRNELIAQAATGITREVDANTQRLFDDGHATEALARPIAEEIIGEDLYPITASLAVDGLQKRVSASYDGTTMDEKTVFEHKRLNAELAASLDAGVIPDMYHPQLEQQLLIIGA
jgi:predicted phage-related endonuclease